MDKNINSFAQTVSNLVEATNSALESIVSISKMATTKDDVVTVTVTGSDPISGDSSTSTYSLPSYNKVLNRLNAVSNTMDAFVKGQGAVILDDGTYRKIKTEPIASAPDKISGVPVPVKFKTKSNWFFEDLIFPQLAVSFDLKGKIADDSDRVVVKRVIFDNATDVDTQWFITNFAGKENTYYEVISKLNSENKRYWEDESVVELPLSSQQYVGYFVITDVRTINNVEWYYLDDVKYAVTSDFPLVKNIQLSVGTTLRYKNSIWKIADVDLSDKRISVTPVSGIDYPSVNGKFDIYNVPFSSKMLDVPIGYNECNILFFKGINDSFNVVGNEWSDSVSFWTNTLTLVNSSDTLESYYNNYVIDFGKQLEGQAKEKFVSAYHGIKPSAPVFSSGNFAVTQINTQLNSALNTDAIRNTQSQIESTKTIINSLKNTIAQQKADLVEETTPAKRLDLNNKIAENIKSLSSASVEYQSLVRSLSTAAYENYSVISNPKYRVRGFFQIPAGKKNAESEREQEVVQFDIAYRYLKLDGTGNALDTFAFTDPSTGQKISGVFSDWIIVQTAAKQKTYDSASGSYAWVNPSVSDGNEVNINQVDIPIQKGEKVEIKIRSISEAGWPYNPLKSDWSDTAIVDFPSNLESSDQILNILSGAQSEETAIKLEETLSSSGVTSHMSDNIPNPNQGEGTYFKHQSSNIAFNQRYKSVEGVVNQEVTTDLQSYLDNAANNMYIVVTGSDGRQYNTSLAKVIQQLVIASGGKFDYQTLALAM